jgi:hypothetical protein
MTAFLDSESLNTNIYRYARPPILPKTGQVPVAHKPPKDNRNCAFLKTDVPALCRKPDRIFFEHHSRLPSPN